MLTARVPNRVVDRRPVAAACVVVFLVALAVAWSGDLRAGSYSDVGGRLATVRMMADRDSWSPEVGYWAESADPAGTYHPLLYTERRGDGWVQSTSLPLVYVEAAMYRLGGTMALAVVPCLGVVAAAAAARRLARWLGDGDGMAALWCVGLLSPVVFYGADVWEHAPATGLALLGLSLVVDRGRGWWPVVGGICLGLAAAMRNELLVVLPGLGVGMLAVRATRREVLDRMVAWITAASAALAVLVGNLLLERIVLGAAVATDRAGDSLTSSGSALGGRARDVVVTGTGVFAGHLGLHLIAGALVFLAAVALAWWATRADDAPGPAVIACVALGALALLWRLSYGLSAVPGLFAACPLAALGLFGARSVRHRALLAGIAVAAAGVWATAWIGQHGPQWGARYLLVPGALLVVLASGMVAGIGLRRPAIAALLGVTVFMSAFGAVWHVHRTHAMVETRDRFLAAVDPDQVVVSEFAHLGRELGWWYGERLWLTVPLSRGSLAGAVEVARAMGAERLAVVQIIDGDDDPALLDTPRFDGYRAGAAESVPFLWLQLVVRDYEAVG